MANAADGRNVIGVSHGGCLDCGLTVRFDLQFADKTTEPFHCGHDVLAKFVGNLRMLGQLAEKVRSAMPGQKLEVVRPYHATEVRGGSDPQTREVVLRFQTPEGIPVEIAMIETVALQARESLEKAILQARSLSDRRN
jgi:hypothetical protein